MPESGWRSATWALVLLTFALSKPGVAQLVLYDNFNSQRIDLAKWDGGFQDPESRDAVRELTAGQDQDNDRRLHLKETTYSAITDDNGASGSIFGLGFPVPRLSALSPGLASFAVYASDTKSEPTSTRHSCLLHAHLSVDTSSEQIG